MSLRRVSCSLLIAGLSATVEAQGPPAPLTPDDTYTHTIVRGDTLIRLAEQLLSEPHRWSIVARLNKVRNPKRLRPGRTLAFPLDRMRSLPGEARVLWVRGKPRVETAGAGTVLALLGATLAPGDSVVTADDESVKLQLSTGSLVTLGEQARITLVELRTLAGPQVSRTRVDVQRGRVESSVVPATHPAQKHEISTPVVIATVRGTEFRVSVGTDAASVATEVTDGSVGVGRGPENVALPAGYGMRARVGVPLAPPRALLPQTDLAALSASSARLPVRVRWPAIAGATAYRVSVAPSGDAPALEDQQVPSPEVTWPDLADGIYRIAVRGIDADDLEGLEATATFTVDARPVPPLVKSSGDGVTYGDSVALEWTRPDGVEAFDLQVATDDGFAATRSEQTAIREVTATLALPPGRYVWRVASRVGEDRGPWGDPTVVELRARPAAGPAPDASVQKRDLTLRWSAGAPGDRYVVQMAADPWFGAAIVDAEVDAPMITVPRPTPGRYHVRVRVVNAEGVSGPFGPTQSLDIPKPPRSKWWWILLPLGAGALVAAF
ncbi:FecR protein [Luteitalea pratensis]|uniref:FecR protein n=1 Tax=Luteitalea pratensis TaxID=1855912 RepID=A0A143PUS7_LUTPR|nr:FecR domain-containing protein [Luteitalea pratensis]AMY12497.1 FecR protein [Luteitalea pratensis]